MICLSALAVRDEVCTLVGHCSAVCSYLQLHQRCCTQLLPAGRLLHLLHVHVHVQSCRRPGRLVPAVLLTHAVLWRPDVVSWQLQIQLGVLSKPCCGQTGGRIEQTLQEQLTTARLPLLHMHIGRQCECVPLVFSYKPGRLPTLQSALPRRRPGTTTPGGVVLQACSNRSSPYFVHTLRGLCNSTIPQVQKKHHQKLSHKLFPAMRVPPHQALITTWPPMVAHAVQPLHVGALHLAADPQQHSCVCACTAALALLCEPHCRWV
jgi:hypothetical protein